MTQTRSERPAAPPTAPPATGVGRPRPGPARPGPRPAYAADANGAKPGQPWLVRRYRRAVPRRVRRLVVAVAGPATRHRVQRVLGAVSRRVPEPGQRSVLRALRATGQLGRPDRRVVHYRGQTRLAVVAGSPTPLHARNENLRLVTGALDAAGVEHFAVRGYGSVSTAVAVPASARARAVAALTALCTAHPGYVCLPDRRKRPERRVRPAGDPASWEALAGAAVVRFACYYADRGGHTLLGAGYGCDVEFWAEEPYEESDPGDGSPGAGRLVAPRFNRVVESVPHDGTHVTAPGHLFTRFVLPGSLGTVPDVRTRPEMTVPLPDDLRFPIDAVYTWVDGDDPAWRRRRAEAGGVPYHAEAANDARYLNRDELRYSLRSLHLYAPWIRHVYLVTDDQAPDWLDTAHPRLTVVDHRDVFTDPGVLPTFNSHAIESQLHHIDGLAEHFLYFNDDVFLGAPLLPDRFFLPSGITRYFPSRALLPSGPPDAGDVPVSVAGKNNRALLQQRFGTYITQKMKHTPHALRRSILAEIEERFPERHRQTAASRFRSATDLSIPSAFHHYYAAFTGRAVPGQIPYDYFDLAHPDLAARLRRLLRRRDRNVFCLNDTLSGAGDLDRQVELIRPFLEAYFPDPSPFEIPFTGPRPGPGPLER
ncbi:sugar phosphotransferase [Streptomyces sp. WAC 06738]|uniref:stealth family protein n=1 Tax=Streptomyces sp. WAC 06738 TaxID=2203210 RepID=UPI000F703DC1|nr:stealth family protein [Streptomyces sp. WAC 06738]AZM46331.1 sugar phosphotransferase [Streptomyces sp. WAC 06738]